MFGFLVLRYIGILFESMLDIHTKISQILDKEDPERLVMLWNVELEKCKDPVYFIETYLSPKIQFTPEQKLKIIRIAENVSPSAEILIINRLNSAITQYYGIELINMMMTKTPGSRKRLYIKARYIAWYIMKERLRMRLSYLQLAQVYGGEDHSTAIFGIKQISEQLPNYRILQDDISAIMLLL